LSLTGTAVSLTASTYVNAAFNSIVASTGNDSIDVSGAATVTSVTGGAGDDVITLSGANSFASGGTGNDTILGGAGADTLNGGISGGDGADSLSGGAGADNMAGDAGNDTILGGSGADTLIGGAGDDSIDGGTEADTIYGGDGNDILLGGTGADSIFGDAGNDTITGGRGNDTLTGGAGNDTFVFTYDLAGDTVTVVDFDHVSQADKIDITDIVNRLPAGAPSSATITEITTDFTGGGALNNATTLVTFYDNGTDTFVYIDVDGNGVWQSTTDLTIKLVGVTGTSEKPVNGDFIKP
jgi:Ca2+-binding RTX toxin-like protein